MNAEIKLLHCGNCEELKLGVHGTALALAVVMGAYNTAAWLLRRERHLAVNGVLYAALTLWEVQHVRHHWAAMGSAPGSPEPKIAEPPEPEGFIGKCA
jgi:hypothetical protein